MAGLLLSRLHRMRALIRRVGRNPLALSFAAATVLWAGLLVVGFTILLRYEHRAGPDVEAPSRWPAGVPLLRAPDRATVVLFAHPDCPCSRASLNELGRLLAGLRERPVVRVAFVRPPDAADGWEAGDLWDTAAAMAGVTAITIDADTARRFGARVSGTTVVYAGDGRLLFSGGITGSRGHEGDNAGRAAVDAVIRRPLSVETPLHTPTFGCYLVSASEL
jgi:hypothetical protein